MLSFTPLPLMDLLSILKGTMQLTQKWSKQPRRIMEMSHKLFIADVFYCTITYSGIKYHLQCCLVWILVREWSKLTLVYGIVCWDIWHTANTHKQQTKKYAAYMVNIVVTESPKHSTGQQLQLQLATHLLCHSSVTVA